MLIYDNFVLEGLQYFHAHIKIVDLIEQNLHVNL